MASTFLTAIPAALVLYDPVLNDTDYILGAGDDTRSGWAPSSKSC